MHRKQTLFYLILILLLQACASPNILLSNWAPEGQNTDQYFNETPASFLFQEDEISLKVFNNEKHLHLVLETGTAITIEKILRLGLSIWIDPTGKINRTYGINFPLPIEDQNQLTQQLSSQELSSANLNSVYQNFTEMELINFTPGETLTLSSQETEEGVLVELLSLGNKLFRYHIRIELKKLLPQMEQLTSDTKVGIAIASVNEPDEAYYSALSSREVIQRKLDQLKAGKVSKREITEHWISFELVMPN